MKIHGIVPARMASSRFPGKPLHPICGKPMIAHGFMRAKQFSRWDSLQLATCDTVIADFAKTKSILTVMTSDKHVRCLDRVAEAVKNSITDINPNDLVICVQGDEPMLHPNMIDAVIQPLCLNID